MSDPVTGAPREPAESPPKTFRTIWISDLHLGAPECQAGRLLDFMRHHESEHLYLVGDIVDGWRLRRSWRWDQLYNDVIQKILRRARKGCRVVYIPGNHDDFARAYADLDIGGIALRREARHTTVDGRVLLVRHGDEFDSVVTTARWLAELGSVAYSAAVALNRWYNAARRLLGYPYWSLSAWLKHRVKNAVMYMDRFEEALAELARRNGADGIVCGHIHHAAIRELGGATYYNTGDWVESCTALVEHFDGSMEIIRWEGERPARPARKARADAPPPAEAVSAGSSPAPSPAGPQGPAPGATASSAGRPATAGAA
jgi:UDP-2,3-diacylglucosamine pyrophosphatase LpxH